MTNNRNFSYPAESEAAHARPLGGHRSRILCYLAVVMLMLPRMVTSGDEPRAIWVPRDFPTIQSAVDAAGDGETVILDHGTYHEGVVIEGKSITLASRYLVDPDPSHIADTVLDGRIMSTGAPTGIRDAIILVRETAGSDTQIVGLTIQHGDDGISCHARINIRDNHFVANVDAIDFEGGGGICERNTFRLNRDDAIDLDLDCHVTIRENWIEDNDDDGIEVRFHPTPHENLQVVIVGNVILRNREDGIQIIDYPERTSRHLRIERNIIADNAMAGIGMMSEGNTEENFEAAAIPEPIEIVNNTIARNAYGICGGANVTCFNNLLMDNRITAIKRVAGKSRVVNNWLWNNRQDVDGMELESSNPSSENPRTESPFQLSKLSPCIDAGIAQVQGADDSTVRAGEIWIHGTAPDIGAMEFGKDDGVKPWRSVRGWTVIEATP